MSTSHKVIILATKPQTPDNITNSKNIPKWFLYIYFFVKQ